MLWLSRKYYDFGGKGGILVFAILIAWCVWLSREYYDFGGKGRDTCVCNINCLVCYGCLGNTMTLGGRGDTCVCNINCLVCYGCLGNPMTLGGRGGYLCLQY